MIKWKNDEDFTENCDDRCRCGLYGRMLLPLHHQKKTAARWRAPVAADQLGGKAVKPEENQNSPSLLAETTTHDGRRGPATATGAYKTDEMHAEDRASGRDDDGLPGHGRGGHAFTKILESVTITTLLLLSDGELRRVPGRPATFRSDRRLRLLTARQQVVRRSGPGDSSHDGSREAERTKGPRGNHNSVDFRSSSKGPDASVILLHSRYSRCGLGGPTRRREGRMPIAITSSRSLQGVRNSVVWRSRPYPARSYTYATPS